MPPPESPARAPDLLATRLSAVVRRMRSADVLWATAGAAGAALGMLLALAAAGVGAQAASFGAGLAVGAWLLARRRHDWTLASAARRLERVRPESRNVIVTAEELQRHPRGVRPSIVARVVAAAAADAAKVPIGEAAPLRRPALVCAGALLALAGAVVLLPPAVSSEDRAAPPSAAEAADPGRLRVVATLSPPDYLDSKPLRLDDPERIEAIADSRLSLEISGGGPQLQVRLGASRVQTSPVAGGVTATTTLAETTYLAIEDGASTDSRRRRLIPVVVTPDRAPAVRIRRPGADLMLAAAEGSIPVSATAADDFGLAGMELRFTRVSGSGEQYEFEEGVLPMRIRRESERAWEGTAVLALNRLDLQPGDALVYRVIGSDRRSGDAGTASSDTFFVEIATPDAVTLGGVELPPDRDRYALSQQMIVLKVQRLRARANAMAREAVADAAALIAAEQRSVRANFIFLTGGHVEDEVEEAGQSHEIQEGRLEHRARREITAAIGHMSRAEQALASVDTASALTAARAAVDALQRAFARNRYLLRSLPVRSRLDPARRLSGDRSDASEAGRAPAQPEIDPARAAAREILAVLFDMKAASSSGFAPDELTRLSALAERALGVDAGSEEWRRISAALLRVRDAVESRASAAEIGTHLTHAVGLVQREARGASPAIAPDPGSRTLRGAWFGEVVRR